jgi:hypothetical protein
MIDQVGRLRHIREIAEFAEGHQHQLRRWYGKRNPQTDVLWASATTLVLPYHCISGDSTWGAGANDEALVFGSGDTLEPGYLTGDFDQILVVSNNSATVYRIRFIWGTGSMADAIAANQWSETMYLRAVADNVRKVAVIQTPLIAINALIWAQCANATDNATLDFYVGVHGYPYADTR